MEKETISHLGIIDYRYMVGETLIYNSKGHVQGEDTERGETTMLGIHDDLRLENNRKELLFFFHLNIV